MSGTYRLCAIDYDGRGLEQAERLRGHLSERAGVEIGIDVLASDGRDMYVYVIERSRLRDSDAHSIGYCAGFVVHIESGETS